MARCRTAHLAILIFSEFGQKSPFLTADLDARPAPLPAMASGGDHIMHPFGGSLHPNGHQPPSYRARIDASSSRALPLTRWGFTLWRRLPWLASHYTSLYLLIGVGLHVLQTCWPSSCRGSSLPKRGGWIARKGPSPRGRMAWRLLSTHGKVCTEYDASRVPAEAIQEDFFA
jgi:hypothetical protein